MPEPARPPRRPLSVERIVAVALSIIDAEGTQAVTMRRVAHELGVTASSLYEHVRNREQLLDLAADAVTDEIGLPDVTGEWPEVLRRWFTRAHEVLTAHGDIAWLHFGVISARPEQSRPTELLLASLLAADVPPELASYGIERLSIYTIADAVEGWEFRRRAHGVPHEEMLANLRERFTHLPRDEFPLTRRHSETLMAAGGEGLFAAGLEILIAGIGALATTNHAVGISGHSS